MQKIKKLADFVLKYGILAWMAAALVWYLIVSTLHRGISCDEGYYLMGFLRNQTIEGQATDFHFITRALCRSFPDDDIMVFRYIRLILNVIALLAFAVDDAIVCAVPSVTELRIAEVCALRFCVSNPLCTSALVAY